MTLHDKIIKAKTLNEMNKLRDEVVKAKDPGILKQWQTKFWALKRCSTCGSIL